MSSVLSIDVGIKNMAVCIRNKETNDLCLLLLDIHHGWCLFSMNSKITCTSTHQCTKQLKNKQCGMIINTIIEKESGTVMCHKHASKKTKITYQKMMENTVEIFAKLINDPQISEVVIEHQRKNNKTKMLATCISTIALVYHKPVRMIEPMDKFKSFMTITKREFKDMGYTRRKKMADETFAKNLGPKFSEIKSQCKTLKIKTNDLADAYLQSFS